MDSEGEFVDRRFDMAGGIAVCRIGRMRKLFAVLCANGFEHHAAMVRTRTAGVVHEAVAKRPGWRVHWYSRPADSESEIL